jgi:four helix bundle protein
MNKEDLKNRTKVFSLSVIKFMELIPNTRAGNTIANQIIRSATSIGANYRAAIRAKSEKDFLNKILIVEEEADETCYGFELLKEAEIVSANILNPLINECNELVAIFTSTGKTLRNKINQK